MKLVPLFFCLVSFFGAGVLGTAKADSLQDILSRMDKEAPSFHGVQADLKMDTYQKIIDSHTLENGQLKMQRGIKGEVKAIIEFTGESARTLFFQGKGVRIYYPRINQYQDVSLGSNAAAVNQYLLLGFGSSGKELAQTYNITEDGKENLSGVSSTRLVLVPKDPKVLEKLPKVELWIPDGGSNPVQQQFFENTGNYRVITYSNMQVNPGFSGPLELKLPKDAKKQRQ